MKLRSSDKKEVSNAYRNVQTPKRGRNTKNSNKPHINQELVDTSRSKRKNIKMEVSNASLYFSDESPKQNNNSLSKKKKQTSHQKDSIKIEEKGDLKDEEVKEITKKCKPTPLKSNKKRGRPPKSKIMEVKE